MKNKYQYWYASLPEISGSDKLRILEYFGDEEAIYQASESVLDRLTQNQRRAILEARKCTDLQREYENYQKKGIGLISWKDEQYPQRLRNIYEPPYAIFYQGKYPKDVGKYVAIVGARACSEYGRVVAEMIGKELAKQGLGIVSGLALGIDSAAHYGALRGDGETYGVLGCGIDVCYPKSNKNLFQKVCETGGILSEYGMGCPPLKYYFPMRNRLISGLADVLIVVEARRKSGSLITAERALEQGKTIYAVPGRISDELSQGTNWLLSQGAFPFCSVEEFLKDIGIKEEKRKKIIEKPLEKNERLVYSVLDFTPKHVEQILEETGVEFAEALVAIKLLVQYNYIEEVYRNYYIKANI